MGKKQQIFQQFIKPRVQSLNTAVLLFFHFRLCAECRSWPLGYAAARESPSAADELTQRRIPEYVAHSLGAISQSRQRFRLRVNA
jgi:hypothetical protein